MDVSDSIDEEDFEKAKDVIKTLIEKISYYEVSPNYEILIFATDVVRIVSMRDFKSGQESDLSDILKRLQDYKYSSKGDRTGTNIALAYRRILESIQIENERNKEEFKQTQHVVIMFTDGQANMGGNPKPLVDQIKYLVQQNSPSEEQENLGIKVKDYIPHPRYDVKLKKDLGIPEYYEFDVALIQLVDPADLHPLHQGNKWSSETFR
ncbi:complement factor B-like protein [Labeo rohita]|uniref:Complement factor B-like protein n=1 Tax=Labeo rohita TaxID=84645 RepID=A0A498P418_LABRO|nr:complement factor B-like protein [Labeo rohita]